MLSKNINPNINKNKEKNKEKEIKNEKEKGFNIINKEKDVDIYDFSIFNYDEKKFINKKEFYQSYFGK
jgi:hypothetical protein